MFVQAKCPVAPVELAPTQTFQCVNPSPASRQWVAVVLLAAAAAAPATVAGRDDDAQSCSLQIHRRDLIEVDVTVNLPVMAPQCIHHCPLVQNRCLQRQAEYAAVLPTIANHTWYTILKVLQTFDFDLQTYLLWHRIQGTTENSRA